jgi:hypothetical protein
MREQKGYVFHRYCWFVRHCDNVKQPDERSSAQVCEKLKVKYWGEYRTAKSVQPSSRRSAPLNSGMLNPQSTMLVSEFVEKVYLPETSKAPFAQHQRQYKEGGNATIARMKLTLRVSHRPRRADTCADCCADRPGP